MQRTPMGHTHTAIAGHVRAAHALRRIAAAAFLRKPSRELVLAARASARRTSMLPQPIAGRSARRTSQHALARHRWAQRSSHAQQALARHRWAQRSSHAIAGRSARRTHNSARCARAIDAWRSTRGTRAYARCARGSARLREAVRAVAQLACCPHATARALLSPSPIRPLHTAHDTRQGCCLVLVHHGLAHCIRTAWATSSLARRHMPALYNTP